MLRSEHGILYYDFARMVAVPDRLMREADAAYVDAVAECLTIYRSGIGRTRCELHEDVESVLLAIPGCPPRRAAAFCKLLDDVGEYTTAAGTASKLRRRVFGLAAPLHPLVSVREGIFDQEVGKVREQIAAELKLSWDEIQDRLFADVIELQRLRSFDVSPDLPPLSPQRLLSRYNVAQVQTALYKATRMQVDFRTDAPYIVRQAKLAGLMHRIQRSSSSGANDPHYRMLLDGPASSLRETSRYGIRFAQMLPALLACHKWRVRANILGPGRKLFHLNLSPADRLRSDSESPPEFDSQLEQDIQAVWNAQPQLGWTLNRGEFLVHRQEVFTPDFILRREDGHVIYVEVLGYWTPEYLRDKRQRLLRFRELTTTADWLLIIDRPASGDKAELLAKLRLPVICFDRRNSPSTWIDAVLSS